MANILYYGGGKCTIEATDVAGLEITHGGQIKIFDKTPDSYHIIANNSKIIIFPTGRLIPLNDLFEYHGTIKIKSVLASDSNFEKVRVTIKKVMDYSELLNTNAEDMTTNSERLHDGYNYGMAQRKTSVDINIITHQVTSNKMLLYDGDGNPYHGQFHVHIDGIKIMSGEEHTNASQELFIKKRDRTKRRTRSEPKGRADGSSGGGGGY